MAACSLVPDQKSHRRPEDQLPLRQKDAGEPVILNQCVGFKKQSNYCKTYLVLDPSEGVRRVVIVWRHKVELQLLIPSWVRTLCHNCSRALALKPYKSKPALINSAMRNSNMCLFTVLQHMS